MKRRFFVHLVLSCILFSRPLGAEELGPPKEAAPDSAPNEFDAAAFDSKMGEVRLIVFASDTSKPIEGATVRAGDVLLGGTNKDGALEISLFGGLYHLSIDIGDGIEREIAVRVIPEESTEVLAEAASGTETLTLSVEQSNVREAAEKTAENVPMSEIEGDVVHEETKQPIAKARVFVRGFAAEAQTDASGHFRMAVPVGVRDIVVVHPDFGTVTKSDVEVRANETTALTIEASPGGVELEELTVTAPKIEGSNIDILSERKDTTEVSDIIGAEQMSKSGDSDAAAALKRVTGITVVGGKYVYVRGLGERYSSSLLNGLRLPSPDPERRVVPLDMFPAGILESMVIQKTFSPEMPGDFGGGTVNLRTRGYPKDPTFKVELSCAFKPCTTFASREFSADSGSLDFLGIDGGHRAIPDALADATRGSKLVTGDRFTDGYSEEEIAEITRAMPNNWKTENRRLAPDCGLTVSGGRGFTIKKTKLGFFSSLLYKNQWEAVDKTVRDYVLADAETGALEVNSDYRFYDTTNTITLGGILALGVDFGNGQSIVADTIIDRITDNGFSRYTGYSADLDSDIDVYEFSWIERMMIVQQVRGSHLLHKKSGLKLDWKYAFSTATQDEPDKRHTRYDYLEGEDIWVLSSGSDGNRRDYITVDEKSHDIGMDITFPFTQWTKEDAEVKAGAAIFLKEREVDMRSFGYENIDAALDVETRALSPSEIFTDENIEAGGIQLQEWTQATDNYTGSQEVFAGYISGDLPLGLGLSVSGGVRFEKSTQEVSTFDVFSLNEDKIKSSLSTFDVLPAAVLTYRFRDDMLIRVGYGKTLNRPDFREMSPGCVSSYAGGGDVCGAPTEVLNPDWTSDSDEERYLPYKLNRTVIHNADVRWEWYFKGDEMISFGGFYKEFIDPIESIMKASAQKGSVLMNAASARDLGLELEFRKNFAFLADPLEDLYFAGNVAWIYSRIKMPQLTTSIQTSKNRPLQGQSPYIVNAQIGYENVDIGLNAALLYNVFGKRISDVGTNGRPDIYEQPFHQLDFVAKKSLKKGFKIGVKAKNIIDLPVRFTQGDEITKKYKKGREFHISVSWTY